MMRNYRHIVKYSLTVVMLLAILIGFASKTFNIHSHVLKDGRVLTHSHATGSSKTNHSHSEKEFFQLDLMQLFFFVGAVSFIFLVSNFYLKNNERPAVKLLLSHHTSSKGRAPPVLV